MSSCLLNLASMLESNPYQPPQSSLENHFKEKGIRGYRDGGYLMVRDGFVGPHVCIKSGTPVEDFIEPETMILTGLRSKNLFYGVILGVVFGVFLAIGIYEYPVLDYFSPTTVALSVALIVFLIIISFRPSGGLIKLYCCSQIKRKRKRIRILVSSLSVEIIACYVVLEWLDIDSIQMILIVCYVLLCGFDQSKKLIKHKGREGDYERFEGAHPHFLETLPSSSELELTSSVSKES